MPGTSVWDSGDPTVAVNLCVKTREMERASQGRDRRIGERGRLPCGIGHDAPISGDLREKGRGAPRGWCNSSRWQGGLWGRPSLAACLCKELAESILDYCKYLIKLDKKKKDLELDALKRKLPPPVVLRSE